MISMLDTGLNVLGSSACQGTANVVFLGRTLHSHSTSLNPGV